MTTDGDSDFHDWTFRNNVFVNISSNANIDLPKVQFVNNTFYRVAYSGSGISYGVSLSGIGPGPSQGTVSNNAFVESGAYPDPYGLRGYYGLFGAAMGGESRAPSFTDSTTWRAIFNNLVTNGYINANGGALAKAKSLTDISQFVLDDAYAAYKTQVYDYLIWTVQLDSLIRSTFVNDYNFVSGRQSDGFPAKPGFAGDEVHGVNGGDPLFQNINNPLGSDGLPFTSDDGLKPLPSSPLCGAGEGGSDIGAYSCA